MTFFRIQVRQYDHLCEQTGVDEDEINTCLTSYEPFTY